jgi:hypothetical protein
MKTNIRTAKTKLFANSTVYYVPSKSGGDTHIVVHNNVHFFCDCKDFMTRRLPLLGTAGFSQCTHGRQVSELVNSKFTIDHDTPKVGYKITLGVSKPVKRYQIFKIKDGEKSESALGREAGYLTREEAQKILDEHNLHCENCPYIRKVFEVVNGKPVEPLKKFRIFYKSPGYPGGENGFWSTDVPGVFDTRREAQTALNKLGLKGPREVREYRAK